MTGQVWEPAPPTEFGAAGDRRVRELTSREGTAVVVLAALTLLLAVLGFANSFHAVADAARPWFGLLAPTVPLAIDLGIAVFSGVDIVLARLGMRPPWVRLIPWSLTGVTVYLNVAGQPSWFARIAHAVFPALWVTVVEITAHVVRVRAGLAAGTAMDRIRPARWLLAPARTAGLWRRMVLWEIRSYPAALARERTRLLALTELQDAYGPLAWRWKAPRRIRAAYRLGELAPAQQTPAIPAPATGTDTTPDANPDTHPASRADSAPDTRADIGRTPRRTRRADTTAVAVARLRARHPDMTVPDIARRLGVSDRTVRRHLSRKHPAGPAAA